MPNPAPPKNQKTPKTEEGIKLAPSLDKFIDHLIEEKKFGKLDPDIKTQIKKDLIDRLEGVVNAKLILALPPDKLAEFEKLLAQDASQTAVDKFLKDNIPNLELYLAGTLADFRKKYLGIL
jgi:hypothetical protein